MRGLKTYRAQLLTILAAVLLAAWMAACGDDDECNHVIDDVPTFEQCQEIAVERRCSNEVVYARANPTAGRPSRCRVVSCGDCNGGIATPTATPTI